MWPRLLFADWWVPLLAVTSHFSVLGTRINEILDVSTSKICTRCLEHVHSSWSFRVSTVMFIQCCTNAGYFLFKFCPPPPPQKKPKVWWFQRSIIRVYNRLVIQLLFPAECLIGLDYYIIFLVVLFISTSCSSYMYIFSCLVLVEKKTDQNRCSWLDILGQFYNLLSDGMYAAPNNAPILPTFLQSLLNVG
jgi:hypothetical protein